VRSARPVKSPSPTGVLAALAAGAAAGAVAGVLVGGRTDPPAPGVTETVALPGGAPGEAARTDDAPTAPLRRELDALAERVAALERAVRRERLAVEPAEPPDEGPAPAGGDLEPDASSLHDAVAAALEAIRAREEAEREARREAQELVALDRRADRLGRVLGLEPWQVDGLREVLLDEREGERALEASRGQLDRATWRARRRELRAETRRALGTVLTPEQLEGYDREQRRGSGGRSR